MYSIALHKTEKSRLSEVDFNDLPFGHTFSDHMFVADYQDGQWGDFRIEPYADMPLSPANMALHYGQSVFEGMKAHWHKEGYPVIFRPFDHLDRLNTSARRLAMPEVPQELFDQALRQLLSLDEAWVPRDYKSALYIRPIMFAMDGFLGVKRSETYRFMILTGPTGPYYAKPVRLWVEEHYVRASRGGVGFAKAAGNYAASIMPAALAKERGYDQILWLDGIEYRYLQECGTMNIFAIIGDPGYKNVTIITPETSDTVLKGITRDSLIKLWLNKGYDVEVRPVRIDEIVEAHELGRLREMFGTGTAAVISHVSGFTFDGNDYTLPVPEQQKISSEMKQYFEEVKAGYSQLPASPEFADWLSK